MSDKKQIAIIGGGTVSPVDSHFGTVAEAYGGTARRLDKLCRELVPEMDSVLYLTKMAGGGYLRTNDDIAELIKSLTNDDLTKVVFFTAAMVDFSLQLDGLSDLKESRLPSGDHPYTGHLRTLPKIIKEVRKDRKDIFLVGFKQTHGKTEDEMYIDGLDLCKKASCNLVLANDTKTMLNMVITPEEARYHVTTDRDEVLRGLVAMTKLRSHLTFTRSTVVAGEAVPWTSDLVPDALRTVVEHCINGGAYKPFNGSTVGHFACKLSENTFLTSRRRTDFNNLYRIGLVKIETDGPDNVIAYGAKPSVGGQSQRIVFKDHPELDCICHFHCPKKPGSEVPTVSQYEFECGSHECGKNTSNGLKKFGNLWAVYLDEHGPNIVFNRNIDPAEVISFIDANFSLNQKTGGFVSIKRRLETPSTLDDLVRLSGK